MLRWCVITFLLFNLSLFGFTPPPNNAVAISLGGACATYTNPFAIQNNAAALAFTDNTLAASIQNRFGLSDYSILQLAGNYSVESGTIGFGYSNSPFGQIGLQTINIAFARKFAENFSAGVGINYTSVRSINAFYPNSNALTFNAGLFYTVNDKLNAGFSLTNPNRTILIRETNERLPAQFRFGIDYQLADKVTLYTDAYQITNYNLQFQAGLEVVADVIKIRAGLASNQTMAFGIAYKKSKLGFDVAIQYHNQLGISPCLNFNYAF